MAQDNGSGHVRKNTTGGQLVVDALLAEGVDTIFGISGSHVLAIYDVLRDTPQIRHVTTSHENNAALMAEAYARLIGRPGVVLVTAGPGATNAATGIAQAYTNAAPVVIITGSVPLNAKREIFHGVDDPTFLAKVYSGITKQTIRAEHVEEIPNSIAKAFAVAQSGRPGPVHVEIDEHVLKTTVENAPKCSVLPRRKQELDAATMDRIVEELRQAKRPMIVAGKGVSVSFAKEELEKAAEVLAAPVIYPLDTLGIMRFNHPWCVGTISTMMGPNPYAVKLMREADLLLGIGLRPEAWNLEIVLRNAPSNFIFIGIDDEQILQPNTTISCVADTKGTLKELIRRFAGNPRTPDPALLAAIESNKRTFFEAFQTAVRPYREKEYVHFGLALEEMAKHITPDTIVVGDVGNHTVWSGTYFTRMGADGYLPVGHWGAMGYAIPGAIGAKIACPEKRVVGITGDGAFLMASADFGTAVQNNLDIVYVVLKDNCYGMVKMLQKRDFGRTFAVDIQAPDFVKYAESFGALGLRAARPSDLRSVFEQAFSAKGTVLVEIASDSSIPYVTLPS